MFATRVQLVAEEGRRQRCVDKSGRDHVDADRRQFECEVLREGGKGGRTLDLLLVPGREAGEPVPGLLEDLVADVVCRDVEAGVRGLYAICEPRTPVPSTATLSMRVVMSVVLPLGRDAFPSGCAVDGMTLAPTATLRPQWKSPVGPLGPPGLRSPWQPRLPIRRMRRASAVSAGRSTAAPPGSSPWRPQIQLPSRQPAADVRDFIRDAKWRLLVMKERSAGGICASHVT